MARRLIIDTSVLVASERGQRPLRDVIEPDDDLAIAAITVAELRTAIELASEGHRAGRSAFLVSVLETLPIEPYDLTTANEHGRLIAYVHREGTKRGAHDVIIATTAAATSRVVLTGDRSARFGELPGVECIQVGAEDPL